MNRLTLKQRVEMATIYIEKYQLVMLSQIAYLQTRFTLLPALKSSIVISGAQKT